LSHPHSEEKKDEDSGLPTDRHTPTGLTMVPQATDSCLVHHFLLKLIYYTGWRWRREKKEGKGRKAQNL
jgi:hypothetical protein